MWCGGGGCCRLSTATEVGEGTIVCCLSLGTIRLRCVTASKQQGTDIPLPYDCHGWPTFHVATAMCPVCRQDGSTEASWGECPDIAQTHILCVVGVHMEAVVSHATAELAARWAVATTAQRETCRVKIALVTVLRCFVVIFLLCACN